MVDAAKVVLDVDVHHVIEASVGCHANGLQRLRGTPLRPESIGTPARSPPRTGAPPQAWSPSEPPGPAPSECPTAAAARPPSECTGAAPVAADTARPGDRAGYPAETPRPPAAQWRRSSRHPPPQPHDCSVPAATLPTGRRPCRSGRTARGSGAPDSAWPLATASAGVLALCTPGSWSLRSCPRAYPHANA